MCDIPHRSLNSIHWHSTLASNGLYRRRTLYPILPHRIAGRPRTLEFLVLEIAFHNGQIGACLRL